MRFAGLFKKILEKQLILRGIISKEEASTIMSQIRFDFMKDGYFTELKEMEIMRERLNMFKEVEDLVGRFYSTKYARLQILKQSEEEIEEMDKEIAEEAAEKKDSPDETEKNTGDEDIDDISLDDEGEDDEEVDEK
jgi:hypothetical protein